MDGFNPRTRVGCDNTQSVSALLPTVSIHAPVWGATIIPPTKIPPVNSFNPRTRVGCDRGFNRSKVALFCFNPRTRVGCDPSLRQTAKRRYVSIHAPVWGATIPPIGIMTKCMFQSTHPCGVRRYVLSKIKLNARFNPRTRVGCDQQPQS